MSYSSSERIFKKLIGRSDIENASQRLDSLMREEHRMATVQDLRATHRVDNRVVNVQHDVQGVGECVRDVDDRVKGVGNKIDVVINGAHILPAW